MRNTPAQRAAFMEALVLAQRRLRTLFDARVRMEGLTQARARALMTLQEHGALNQRELAEHLGIEGPTLARMIDAMEQQRLVTRSVSAQDRRVRDVTLTEAGLATARRARAVAETTRAELLGHTSPADLAVATRVLETLAKACGSARVASTEVNAASTREADGARPTGESCEADA